MTLFLVRSTVFSFYNCFLEVGLLLAFMVLSVSCNMCYAILVNKIYSMFIVQY